MKQGRDRFCSPTLEARDVAKSVDIVTEGMALQGALNWADYLTGARTASSITRGNAMYVRTIYATGDPAKVDAAAERLTTQGQELLSGQPGFRGMGLFVDRELGKLLVGTWWESEKNRQASDEKLREQRMAMLLPFAQTVAVDNWEAAVVRPPAKRLQPGAGFRLTRLEFAPSDAELLEETFQSTALPRLEMVPGFVGASLFVDRAAGRATVGMLYTDRKALVASRTANAEIRGESVPKAHVTLRSLEEFEVVTVAVPPT